jgi:hypothetical protein
LQSQLADQLYSLNLHWNILFKKHHSGEPLGTTQRDRANSILKLKYGRNHDRLFLPAPLTDWGGSELIIRLQAGSIPARRMKFLSFGGEYKQT